MNHTLTMAEQAMRSRRYAEAIVLFDSHLEKSPSDLKPLLQVGICHLLNRSEDVFLHIYRVAAAIVDKTEKLSEDVKRLWKQYGVLVKKVTATAVLVSTVATTMSACTSSHKYSGGVYLDEPDAGQTSSHKYSGGVFLDSSSVDGSLDADLEGGAPEDVFTSAHRYSGGVYLDSAAISDEDAH